MGAEGEGMLLVNNNMEVATNSNVRRSNPLSKVIGRRFFHDETFRRSGEVGMMMKVVKSETNEGDPEERKKKKNEANNVTSWVFFSWIFFLCYLGQSHIVVFNGLEGRQTCESQEEEDLECFLTGGMDGFF